MGSYASQGKDRNLEDHTRRTRRLRIFGLQILIAQKFVAKKILVDKS